MSKSVQSAKDAWGNDMPDWVLILAEKCDASSQVKVAKELKRSTALVNLVLNNKYTGDMQAVEDYIRGFFMNKTIACPSLGEIPANDCHDWRKKAQKFSNANILRVRMYRACTSCPVNQKDH